MFSNSKSTPRPPKISLHDAFAIFIAYIDEYLDYRHSLWESYFNKVLQIFSSTPSERTKACQDIRSEIIATKPDQIADLFRIIQRLGKLAKVAQEEKLVSMLPKRFADLLRDEYSAFAKMCHAVRTCMVYHIRESELRPLYDAELQRLNKLFDEKRDEMRKKRTGRRNLHDVEADIHRIVQELQFLQDPKMLGIARENKWLDAMTDAEVDQLNLPPALKETFYNEYPLFYQDNYFDIYSHMDLDGQVNKAHAVRQNSFSRHLTATRKLLMGANYTPIANRHNQFVDRMFAESDVQSLAPPPPPPNDPVSPLSEQELYERELREQLEGPPRSNAQSPAEDSAPLPMDIKENYNQGLHPPRPSALQANSLHRPELTRSEDLPPPTSPQVPAPMLKPTG